MYTHVPFGTPTRYLNNLRINIVASDVSFRTNFTQLSPFTGTVKLCLLDGFIPSFCGKLQQVGMRLTSAEQVTEISFTPRGNVLRHVEASSYCVSVEGL
jgi:hypothetical protein